MVKNYIDGNTTVKKNNAVDHLKLKIHFRAVLQLKEKQTTSAGKEIAQETGSQKNYHRTCYRNVKEPKIRARQKVSTSPFSYR